MVRNKIDWIVGIFETRETLEGTGWISPLVGDDWPGVFEMKFRIGDVQYRPLCGYGPSAYKKSFTILVGAREIGDKFNPKGVREVALDRLTLIKGQGGEKYVRVHGT